MTFVGVGSQDSAASIANFVSSRGVDGFAHISDVSGDVWRMFEISGQPAYVFVSANGSEARFGSLDEGEIQSNINNLFG